MPVLFVPVVLGLAVAGCDGGGPTSAAPAATGTAATSAAPAPGSGSSAPAVSDPPTPTGASSTPTPRPGSGGLAERLRAGGFVLYLRHPMANVGTDDPTPDLADRSTQRNLSATGRAQAQLLGQALRRLRIPVGAVLTSPYARTREAGELAFGADRVRTTRDLINEAYPGTDDRTLARALRRLLTTRPPAGQNTVLISHGFNLQTAVGVQLAEGEAAVFAPDGGTAPRLVTRITVDQWRTLASRR